jgi:signal transduction histidine kinase
MDLDSLCRALPPSETDTRDRIRAVADLALTLAKDIQALSHRLYPSKLEYLGLVSASRSFCRDLSKQQNVQIAFSHEGVPETVPLDVALSLFRVLQEAVTNAVTHARAGIDVALRGSARELRLEVSDSGTGFDPDAVLNGHAPGLVGMRERIRLAGGELSIRSRPGAGTSISARVPWAEENRPTAPARSNA